MGHRSVDGDVPDAVLGISTDESLSAEVPAQKVDTSQSLPSLDWVCADATLKLLVDFPLPGLAHGIILAPLDGSAQVVVNGQEDVLDGDIGIPRREAGVGGNIEQPRQVTHTKPQSGQWGARGRLSKDCWRKAWVGLGGGRTHVVLKVRRDERGMEVHTGGHRCGWDERKGICLGDWRRCVDAGMWRGGIGREGRGIAWRREGHVREGRRRRRPRRRGKRRGRGCWRWDGANLCDGVRVETHTTGVLVVSHGWMYAGVVVDVRNVRADRQNTLEVYWREGWRRMDEGSDEGKLNRLSGQRSRLVGWRSIYKGSVASRSQPSQATNNKKALVRLSASRGNADPNHSSHLVPTKIVLDAISQPIGSTAVLSRGPCECHVTCGRSSRVRSPGFTSPFPRTGLRLFRLSSPFPVSDECPMSSKLLSAPLE